MTEIISISDDQNEVKTDDGKMHMFVEKERNIEIDIFCSLYTYQLSYCHIFCLRFFRNDGKDGNFQLKPEAK